MKIAKKLISIVLVCLLCLSLCACGISEDKAVGTWTGSYVYNGNSFSVAFILNADGNYSYASYKNGSFNKAESGTWEIKGGKVILHENGNVGISTKYKYKGGALVNNDHQFYKK